MTLQSTDAYGPGNQQLENYMKEIQWAPRGSSCLLGQSSEYNLYKLTTSLALLKLTVDLDFLSHHEKMIKDLIAP